MEDWSRYVVIFQEKFLLLRWRRNVTKSFSLLMRDRIENKPKAPNENSIGDMVVQSGPQRYRWRKRGYVKYKRDSKLRLKFKEDQQAAQNYVTRACESTW